MIAHPYEQQNDAQGQEESRAPSWATLNQLPGREQHPKENQEHAEEGYGAFGRPTYRFRNPSLLIRPP